jgi:hypothetical protein
MLHQKEAKGEASKNNQVTIEEKAKRCHTSKKNEEL